MVRRSATCQLSPSWGNLRRHTSLLGRSQCSTYRKYASHCGLPRYLVWLETCPTPSTGQAYLLRLRHRPKVSKNWAMVAWTSARWERFGKCGPPATTWRCAPGMVAATRRDMSIVGKLSSEPPMTSTGHRIRAHSWSHSPREY